MSSTSTTQINDSLASVLGSLQTEYRGEQLKTKEEQVSALAETLLHDLPQLPITTILAKTVELSSVVKECSDPPTLAQLFAAFRQRGWERDGLAGYLDLFGNMPAFDLAKQDLSALAHSLPELSFARAIERIRSLSSTLEKLPNSQLDRLGGAPLLGALQERRWLQGERLFSPRRMSELLAAYGQMHSFVMQSVIGRTEPLGKGESTQLVGRFRSEFLDRWGIRHPDVAALLLQRVRRPDTSKWAQFLEGIGELEVGRLLSWMAALTKDGGQQLPLLEGHLPPITEQLLAWFAEQLPYLLLGPALYEGKVGLDKPTDRVQRSWVGMRRQHGEEVFKGLPKGWQAAWVSGVRGAYYRALGYMVDAVGEYNKLVESDAPSLRAEQLVHEWACIAQLLALPEETTWETAYAATKSTRQTKSARDLGALGQAAQTILAKRDEIRASGDRTSLEITSVLFAQAERHKRVSASCVAASSSSTPPVGSTTKRTQSLPRSGFGQEKQ